MTGGGSLAAPQASPPHAAGGLVGFLFDADRCTGCAACSLACSTENELGWGESWRQVVSFNPRHRPGLPSYHLSLACNHCSEAPCVTHCPTGAMTRDADTGAVVVNEETCIGCGYCGWVCPFDAPRLDTARGVMTKCTLCSHRLRDGMEPACVEACPTQALGYGPLAGAPTLLGFPAADVGPRIRFADVTRPAVPARAETGGGHALSASALTHPLHAPRATASAPRQVMVLRTAPVVVPPRRLRPTRMSLRGEWPLWFFTSVLAGLVAWVLASVAGDASVHPWAFVGLAALGLAVSTSHLGRPLRAWRALARVRTSHLSREIGGTTLFLGAATVWLAWGGGGTAPVAHMVPTVPGGPGPEAVSALGWGVAALGLLALVLADRVYDPVRPDGLRVHTGDTLLMAPLLATAFLAAPSVYAAVAAVKLALYVRRHTHRGAPGSPQRHAGRAWPPRPGTVLRVACLVAPPLLWVAAPGVPAAWGAAVAAAGEILDRGELYRSLVVTTPALQAIRDAGAPQS